MSIERAALDYGVVVTVVDAEVCEYEIDTTATAELRADIRASRHGWLEADAETVAAHYRNGEISMLDVIRRFGVILHWETGELFPKSTKTFREQDEEAQRVALGPSACLAAPGLLGLEGGRQFRAVAFRRPGGGIDRLNRRFGHLGRAGSARYAPR